MRRKTIGDAQKLAKNKKGKCLSKKNINNGTKMLWQCEKGHRWKTTYNKIQQGSWCPECAGNKKKTLQDAQKLAENKKGKCLSKKYINSYTKMEWQCNKGHKWKTSYGKVQQGHWCQYCGMAKNTLQDAQNLAEKKNGKCLSNEYTNSYTKMEWQCSKGHKWKTAYGNIRQGSWCPKCNINKTQVQLSNILSKLIGEEPLTIRPQWLKNPKTGYNLEIDIYFPKYKIAVEYNGEQHYEPVNFAGKGKGWAEQKLKIIRARDRLKQRLIKQNPDKIKYFIIFTYRNKITEKNIKSILKKKGIKLYKN